MVGRQDPQCHCRHHDGIQTSRKQDVDIVGVVLRNEKNERRVPDVAKNGVRIRIVTCFDIDDRVDGCKSIFIRLFFS